MGVLSLTSAVHAARAAVHDAQQEQLLHEEQYRTQQMIDAHTPLLDHSRALTAFIQQPLTATLSHSGHVRIEELDDDHGHHQRHHRQHEVDDDREEEHDGQSDDEDDEDEQPEEEEEAEEEEQHSNSEDDNMTVHMDEHHRQQHTQAAAEHADHMPQQQYTPPVIHVREDVEEEKLQPIMPSLLLNPYSPFVLPPSPVANTCECHRASQSALSTVPIASVGSSLSAASSFTSSFSFTPSSTCHRASCSLVSALSMLRQSERMADVCFVLGCDVKEEGKSTLEVERDGGAGTSSGGKLERVYAHRTILSSRSSVFDAMFTWHKRVNGDSASSSRKRRTSSASIDSDDGDDPNMLVIPVPDISAAAFHLMLDFIYLDKVPSPLDCTERNVATLLHYPSLLYASMKYDLPRLQGAVRTALHTVLPSIACKLWQALLAMQEKSLAAKYHTYILQHGRDMALTDGWLELPEDLLLLLVKDDKLQVNELQLFKSLWAWMEKVQNREAEEQARTGEWIEEEKESREDSLQARFKCSLLPHVRFPLMSAREIAVHIAPTGLLSDAELAQLFIYVSGNKQQPLPACFNAAPRVACPTVIQLTYQHDGDDAGLLYYLGTQGYTQPFSNPHLAHRCVVTFSSLQVGQVSMVTSRRRDVSLWTHNRAGSWMEVDVDPANTGTLLVPSHITLQHGYDRPVDSLTNWLLEGSTDRWQWDTLLEKRGVVAFRQGYEKRTWALPSTIVKGYRMLRIRIIGRDSSERTEFLCVGGIELYGELHVMQRSGRLSDGRREDDESKQGEKRQREDGDRSLQPDDINRPPQRLFGDGGVPDVAGAAVGVVEAGVDQNAAGGMLDAAAAGVSDVTAVVDEDRRCWKAARLCVLM